LFECVKRKPVTHHFKDVKNLVASQQNDVGWLMVVPIPVHLRRILSKYASYCSEVRTHLSPGKDLP
jgi:hypothetical protein